MNRYYIDLAETYRMRAEKGQISKEEADWKRAVYAFLGTSSDEMINEMFDSGAFNSIVKGYVTLALKNTGTDEEKTKQDLQELQRLFDTIKAKDAESHASVSL